MIYFRRHMSAESAEKKLPKPLYILLAIVSIVVILLIGWCSTKVVSAMSDAANNVLELYTE